VLYARCLRTNRNSSSVIILTNKHSICKAKLGFTASLREPASEIRSQFAPK